MMNIEQKESLGEEMIPRDESNQTNEKGFYDVVLTLPTLIKQCVDLMDTPIEKQMTLYATTVVAGVLMPHVHFTYDKATNYPNLYFASVFPPASGKGRLAFVGKLLNKVSDEQICTNRDLSRKYKMEMEKFKKKGAKEEGELPEEPMLPLLQIPGNITSAMLMKQLAQNDQKSMTLIFETEADSFTKMMKSQFGGDNSTILRTGFHNEVAAQMRKGNSELLVAKSPKLALVLSGTYSQLPALFQTVEDGTFSRFMVLTGGIQNKWKDVSPCDACVPINDHIEKIGNQFYAAFHAFKDKKIEVKFTDQQWKRINQFGEQGTEVVGDSLGENAPSIPRRHALMITKIAAVFTGLRYFEDQTEITELECSDADFNNAYWMAEKSFECSIALFESLSREKKVVPIRSEELYDLLPEKFKKKEVAPLQAKLKVGERQIERELKKLVESGKLTNPSKGYYQKVQLSVAA